MIGSKVRWGSLVVLLAALVAGTARSQDEGKRRRDRDGDEDRRHPETLPVDATSPGVEILKPAPGKNIPWASSVEVVARVTDDSGRLKLVLINGTKAVPRQDGLYARTVEVKQGVNKVTVAAQDHAENTATAAAFFRCQPPPDVKGAVEVVFKGHVDDPTAKVTVNGKPAKVNADGTFECPVVPDANGKITVVAVDEFGNESRTIHDVRGR